MFVEQGSLLHRYLVDEKVDCSDTVVNPLVSLNTADDVALLPNEEEGTEGVDLSGKAACVSVERPCGLDAPFAILCCRFRTILQQKVECSCAWLSSSLRPIPTLGDFLTYSEHSPAATWRGALGMQAKRVALAVMLFGPVGTYFLNTLHAARRACIAAVSLVAATLLLDAVSRRVRFVVAVYVAQLCLAVSSCHLALRLLAESESLHSGRAFECSAPTSGNSHAVVDGCARLRHSLEAVRSLVQDCYSLPHQLPSNETGSLPHSIGALSHLHTLLCAQVLDFLKALCPSGGVKQRWSCMSLYARTARVAFRSRAALSKVVDDVQSSLRGGSCDVGAAEKGRGDCFRSKRYEDVRRLIVELNAMLYEMHSADACFTMNASHDDARPSTCNPLYSREDVEQQIELIRKCFVRYYAVDRVANRRPNGQSQPAAEPLQLAPPSAEPPTSEVPQSLAPTEYSVAGEDEPLQTPDDGVRPQRRRMPPLPPSAHLRLAHTIPALLVGGSATAEGSVPPVDEERSKRAVMLCELRTLFTRGKKSL